MRDAIYIQRNAKLSQFEIFQTSIHFIRASQVSCEVNAGIAMRDMHTSA